MRPRISASAARIAQLQGKVNDAKDRADISAMRRAQGVTGVLLGEAYESIAQIVGVTTETIRLWVNAYLVDGLHSIKGRKSPGRPPKLNRGQHKQLKNVIKNGPEAAGYTSGCWNCAMVQDYIQKMF